VLLVFSWCFLPCFVFVCVCVVCACVIGPASWARWRGGCRCRWPAMPLVVMAMGWVLALSFSVAIPLLSPHYSLSLSRHSVVSTVSLSYLCRCRITLSLSSSYTLVCRSLSLSLSASVLSLLLSCLFFLILSLLCLAPSFASLSSPVPRCLVCVNPS